MFSGWNQAIIDDVRGLTLQGQPHQKHVYDTWNSFLASNDQNISNITLEYFLLTQFAAIGVRRLYLTGTFERGVLLLGLLDLVMRSNRNIS